MFKIVIQIFLIVSACCVINVANAYVEKMEDPLRPPEYRSAKPSNSKAVKKAVWYVNEILFSGERRVAIVNNVAVGVGDSINGAWVVAIKPEHVVLKYKGKNITARMKMVSVKKKVKQN